MKPSETRPALCPSVHRPRATAASAVLARQDVIRHLDAGTLFEDDGPCLGWERRERRIVDDTIVGLQRCQLAALALTEDEDILVALHRDSQVRQAAVQGAHGAAVPM